MFYFIQEVFVRNSLHILSYYPNLKQEILELIILKMLQIDVRNVDNVYLSMCLSVCLSIYLSVYVSVCLSVCLSLSLSLSLIRPFGHCCDFLTDALYEECIIPVVVSAGLYVYRSISLSVYPSIHLSVYMYISIYI